MGMRSMAVAGTMAATLCAANVQVVFALSLEQGACEPQWVPTFKGPHAPNNVVEALLVHDDGAGPGVYVGGWFTSVGGLTVNHIARWDLNKNEWSPLGQGLSTQMFDSVYALIIFDDGSGGGPQLFAGGIFPALNNLAKWDGATWTSVGPSNSSVIYAMEVFDDGKGPALYAGGLFGSIGVAKWNGGNSWTPVGVSGYVTSLAVFNDSSGPALYAGGSFNDPGANIAKWDGQRWSSLGSGVIHWVDAMVVHNDGSGPALFVGGKIVVAGGDFTGQIAKWNAGLNGGFWSGFGPNTDCPGTDCLGYCGKQSPVGCYCDELCCSFTDCCFDKYATCGGCGAEPIYGCYISSFAVHDDGSGNPPVLVAGGYFPAIGNEIAHSIARWNGTSWGAFGEGFPSHGFGFDTRVAALASFPGVNGSPPALFAGGQLIVGSKFPGDVNFLEMWQECAPCAAVDLNCDGSVNVIDLLAVINDWGLCQACPADVNGDGTVNVADLLMVINNWG